TASWLRTSPRPRPASWMGAAWPRPSGASVHCGEGRSVTCAGQSSLDGHVRWRAARGSPAPVTAHGCTAHLTMRHVPGPGRAGCWAGAVSGLAGREGTALAHLDPASARDQHGDHDPGERVQAADGDPPGRPVGGEAQQRGHPGREMEAAVDADGSPHRPHRDGQEPGTDREAEGDREVEEMLEDALLATARG